MNINIKLLMKLVDEYYEITKVTSDNNEYDKGYLDALDNVLMLVGYDNIDEFTNYLDSLTLRIEVPL